jgi:hypothetical protein
MVDTAAVVHPVFGLAVKVRVTTPVSPVPGAYVGVNVEAFVKVPVPFFVQRILA